MLWDEFRGESIGSVRNRGGLDVRWQSYGEAGSAICGKVGPDLTTVQLDDLPADIQPQTQSPGGILGSGLEEALEDLTACLDRDADATIADRELESIGSRLGERYDDRLSVKAVLDGVIEEI